MYDFYELNSPYEELNVEHNVLADNINEVIPFSISDNSTGTGSEEKQFTNKKRIKNKDELKINSLERKKDIDFCESQKCIELNEEEERDNTENIKGLKCQNKKTQKAIAKKYSNDRLDSLTGQRAINSKFTENVSFKSENEKIKLLEEQNLSPILKNKENPQAHKLNTLNRETNAHTGKSNLLNDSQNNTQNNPETLEKKVINTNLGNLESENKSLNNNIKEEDKKIENSEKKSEKLLESNKEELEKIKEEKQQNDSLQDEKDIEDNYDDNYDPQSILPNQSNGLDNKDELLNISLSNVETNKKQYNGEGNQDDDSENVTKTLLKLGNKYYYLFN